MIKSHEALYYGDYLQLSKLLDAQLLKSGVDGPPAHDEMLFIIVHQTYELWFKQILWEMDGVFRILNNKVVEEKALGRAVAHLERIVSIQRVLTQQIDVLETMTPLDFLDFRDYLVPASGFQSAQWRLMENRLGMRIRDRHAYTTSSYTSRFSESDKDLVEATEKEPNLFDLVQSWLERTPFIQFGLFDFWEAYRVAVDKMLKSDEILIRRNPTLTAEETDAQIGNLKKTSAHFAALFDKQRYAELLENGQMRISHRALQAALLIHLYRDEPILHLPFRLLQVLGDIDENFTTWRSRHAQMVKRMIGTKIGTGGSSGHEYLQKVAENNKVFGDLINMSTFFIPRSELPALPEEVATQLGFYWRPDK
ncbi:MAG: tryptophan 2,3-dioxygenase family protein [Bacteroidetes bacterium]|nr:tryptophan 2,3-dioxygenase family protein [Bacteroidota bacterium]